MAVRLIEARTEYDVALRFAERDGIDEVRRLAATRLGEIDRKIPLLHQALSYRRQRIQRRWYRSEIVDMPFIEKPSRLG